MMNNLVKYLLLLFLAGVIAVGSFAAGMVFYAKFYGPIATSVSTAMPFPVTTGIGKQTELTSEDIPPEFATFWEAWSFLNDQFYGEIPPDNERVYGAIRGMVASFGDQHTGFIDPVRSAVFSENISGSFEGIGATIRLDARPPGI
jgi:carboxyl-terminal processing protease